MTGRSTQSAGQPAGQPAEQPPTRLSAAQLAGTPQETLLDVLSPDALLTLAREKLKGAVERIIYTSVSMSRTAEPGTGKETIKARNRDCVLTITRETVAGEVRVAMTTLPRNRGDEEWSCGGTNKIDVKGRVFIPKQTLKTLTPAFMYREINPNGKAPVIILSKDRITPTDKLIGPTPLTIDSVNRITLTDFPGSGRLTKSRVTFHVRGDLIIVLPEDEPEPGWELMDKFVHPED